MIFTIIIFTGFPSFFHETYMLSQQLLPVAPQGVEVVPCKLADSQRLEGGVEVVRSLKTQQGLLENTPPSDLRCRTRTEIMGI